MRKPLYKIYSELEPIGAYSFCSVFGLLVWEPYGYDKYDCDFVCAWVYQDGQMWGFHRHKVHVSSSGRRYLHKGNYRIYIDEIVRL